MNARPLFVWAAMLGCFGSDTVHWPVPPAIPTARAMIIVLEDREGVSRFGFDLDDRGALSGPIALVSVEGGAMLTAFYYEMSLAELGLSPGALDPVDDCLLTHPMFIAESEGSEWSEAPAAIARLLDPESCRLSSACRTFRVWTLRLEGAARVLVALALDEERALVAAEDGLFYEATFDEVVRADRYAGQPHHAAMIDRTGELWLGGIGGRIVKGPLAGPFSEIRPAESEETIAAMVESPEGRVLALAVITASVTPAARIYEIVPEKRLLGEIHHLEIEPILGEMIWFGDKALAVAGAETAMVIDGDRFEETTPAAVHPLGRIRLSSVERTREQAFIGGSGGLVYYSEDLETWLPIPADPLGTATQAFAVFGRGILFGSDDGAIGQHYPLRAVCVAEGVSSIEIHHMEPVGGRVLMGGGPRDNPVNLLYWLEAL